MMRKHRRNLKKPWKTKLDGKLGMTCTEMDVAMNKGKLKGYYIFGEDPAHTNANVKLREKPD